MVKEDMTKIYQKEIKNKNKTSKMIKEATAVEINKTREQVVDIINKIKIMVKIKEILANMPTEIINNNIITTKDQIKTTTKTEDINNTTNISKIHKN